MFWIALTGYLFGFVGSIPVAGPVAVLVVARGLDGRLRDGTLIGLGAAVAEACYAFLAYRGFSVYLIEVPMIAHVSRGVGTAVLATVGILLLRHRHQGAGPRADTSESTSLALGFSISALNPTLIFTWATAVGVFASVGGVDARPSAAVAFALGVGIGSASWFTIAVRLVDRFRSRVSDDAIARCHRVFGYFVVCLAAALGVAFVHGLRST